MGAPPAGKSPQKRWAHKHKRRLRQLENGRAELIIFPDGPLRHERSVCFTGTKVVGFREGTAQSQTRFALGSAAEVYDTVMEGLAREAEMVRQWFHVGGHGI